MTDTPQTERPEIVERLQAARQKLREEISQVVIGQEKVIDLLLVTLLCRGHALMIGVPARAESARLAWTPYMFYPSFPALLENVVGLPTLVVWGKQDQIVPFSAAEVYKSSIPGAELVAFDNCGHRPEVEKQAEFSQHLQRFLA